MIDDNKRDYRILETPRGDCLIRQIGESFAVYRQARDVAGGLYWLVLDRQPEPWIAGILFDVAGERQ